MIAKQYHTPLHLLCNSAAVEVLERGIWNNGHCDVQYNQYNEPSIPYAMRRPILEQIRV